MVVEPKIFESRNGVTGLGDSGGPAVYFNSINEPILVGVIVGNVQYLPGQFRNEYARLDAHKLWIEETTGILPYYSPQKMNKMEKSMTLNIDALFRQKRITKWNLWSSSTTARYSDTWAVGGMGGTPVDPSKEMRMILSVYAQKNGQLIYRIQYELNQGLISQTVEKIDVPWDQWFWQHETWEYGGHQKIT